ncbi:DUF2909 domain-containing protein [Thalassotalea agarivorans]|uniref:DUF2909 domain-containing protein n=1 Tax=Thalassotalea agarivorans TaxID=349064 RepID=A0A1I0HPD9_THASX|nr:DUF2909 domain-containing protein [Thalassotalea agarivorans]SET85654.1 Protein of unknown function [Thalassotalea agarivorans]
MWIKGLILLLLALMIFNLFRALFVMNSNNPNKPPMSKFIGRRVMFSAAIVLLLVVLILTGVITPNPHPR